MKFRIQVLVFFSLFAFGCSSQLDATYDKGHTPPSNSSTYKNYPQPSGKRKPATQTPYKIKGVKYTPIANAAGFVQNGLASWYGRDFHGKKTSNGEIYNMNAMTAAHKTLPMNTWINVHNLENNKKIVVRVNDRGPFIRGRIVDLSYTGAKRLGIVGPGTARVKLTALGHATSYSSKTKDPVSFEAIDYWKGNLSVQVGAFKHKANAEKYRNQMSKSFKDVHISPFTDNRGTFYTVRIGRFTDLNDTIRFKEKLAAKGFNGAFAVAK